MFGRGRPPAWRSACSSESTAAPACPGTTVLDRMKAGIAYFYLSSIQQGGLTSSIFQRSLHFTRLAVVAEGCDLHPELGAARQSAGSALSASDPHLPLPRRHNCSQTQNIRPWSQNILQRIILLPERILHFFGCVFK